MSEKIITQEGRVALKIVELDIIQHRFKAPEAKAFEVKVTGMRNGEGGVQEIAEAYLPICDDYLPSGLQKDGIEKECQKTFQTLGKLGVPGDGMELAKAEEVLVGQVVEFFGKKNAGGYLNWYINTGKPEEKVDAKTAQEQVMALYGGGQDATFDPAKMKAAEDAELSDEADPFKA